MRVPRLVQDLSVARADGTYRVELQRLARFDVLVLDDLLIGPLKDAERRVHNAHVVALREPSMRKKKGIGSEASSTST